MKRNTDYPIKLDLGDGTARYISVEKANKIIRDLHKQIDKLKAKKPVNSEKEFNRIIGENIRRERGVLHLTAAYVSKKTGLSVSFLSEVENGKRGIGSENLLKIAQAIGCTMEDLLRGVT